jgi:putative membrane protein
LSVTETQDATRRTRLANERTYLAWSRTGLTSFAVCIGLGRVVPSVSHVTNWPYQAVGAGYGAFGISCLLVGHFRLWAIERAVDRGEFARLDPRINAGLLLAGVALGATTIALVVFGS